MRALAWLIPIAPFGLLSHALAADDPGQKIFRERCIVCHQADAHGAAGVAPSLAGTLIRFRGSDTGRRYLAQILVSGMIGPIDTEGHKFSGLMPGFAADLSDSDIAAAINFVLGTFNGASDTGPERPISPQEVAAARASNPIPTGTRALRQSVSAP